MVAILLSVLAALSLPRQSVRERFAGLSPMGRFQFFLFAGGVWVFAALFWIEVWRESQSQGGGVFLTVTVGGAVVWALVLAASGIPAAWRGRGRKARK